MHENNVLPPPHGGSPDLPNEGNIPDKRAMEERKKKAVIAVQKSVLKRHGRLELSPMELAKDALSQYNYDVDKLLANDTFKVLEEEEVKILRESARQKIKYLKKKEEAKIQMTKMARPFEQNLKQSKASPGDVMHLSQQLTLRTIQLYTEELTQTNSEEQVQLLMAWNAKEHLSLCEYLFGLSAVPSFLKNLIQMLATVINYDQEEHQQLRLFLSICGLYKGNQKLDLKKELYHKQLSYLTSEPDVTQNQAVGFIKASFHNDISLVDSDSKALQVFDRKFGSYLDFTYSSIQTAFGYPERPFSILPHTCLVLSQPLIACLKDKEEPLALLPSDYYPLVLRVIVYTFSDDQEAFDELFINLKQGLKYWQRVKHCHYDVLLIELIKRLQAHDMKWLHNLSNVSTFLKDTMTLAAQNKIIAFTPELCSTLLDEDQPLQELLVRPSLIEETVCVDTSLFIQEVMKYNNNNKKALSILSRVDYCNDGPTSYEGVLDTVGIKPIAQQDLALRLKEISPQLFLNPGMGMGKSILLCGLAIAIARKDKQGPVIVLNSNNDLLYRDYNRVTDAITSLQSRNADLKLSAHFVKTGSHIEARSSQIFFMTPVAFAQAKLVEQTYNVLYDEFHRDLFEEGAQELIRSLRKSKTFLAVTGAPLLYFQIQFIQQVFQNSVLVRFPDQYQVNCSQKIIDLCPNQAKHVETLLNLAKQERTKAPVIIIVDEQIKAALLKSAEHRRGPIEVLFGDQISGVEVSAKITNTFTKKINEAEWGCYLISRDQGTGSDFLSSTDIEACGGIRVIIAIQPTTYNELLQFQRRTGRIGNKGQVFYVLRRPKNYAGSVEAYLSYLYTLLKGSDELTLKDKISSIKSGLNEILIEEQDEKEESNRSDEDMDVDDSDQMDGLTNINEENKEEISLQVYQKELGNHSLVSSKNGQYNLIKQEAIATQKLQKKFKEQLNIKDKNKDVQMKNEQIEQIDTSQKPKKNVTDDDSYGDGLNSEEEVAEFCETCGQLYHDCTCLKVECLEKDLQRVDTMVKNALRRRIEERLEQLLFKQKNKSLRKMKYEEDVKPLVQIMMEKLGVSSQEAFYEKLRGIHGVANNNELLQTLQRTHGSYNTELKAAKDFIEKYDQFIAGQDVKNNAVLQSQGKQTNKRTVAPKTQDENAITPRYLQKTSDNQNVYEALKQDNRKKFIRGSGDSFGFQNEVTLKKENKRIIKQIEKNENVEQRQLRQRKNNQQ